MSIVHVCTVRVPVPRSRCIGAWAPRCFLGSARSRLGASVFSRLGASAPRRLGAAVPRCLHVSSVLYHLICCIYARLYATFSLQCEVSRLPPSSTSQMTRGGTSPRYEFRLRLFNYRPPSPAHSLDFNVQARWRGGVVFEKGTPKFVPRARPAAGYLRSGGWGWLAHFADNPRRGEPLHLYGICYHI